MPAWLVRGRPGRDPESRISNDPLGHAPCRLKVADQAPLLDHLVESAPIAGGYWNGCTIPFRENLQEISKDIQDVLQVGFKPAISSAVRPRQSMIHRVEQRQPRPTYGRASERILPHPAA